MANNDGLIDELRRVVEELEQLKTRFFAGTFGVLMLPTEHEAKWSALLRETKSLFDEGLGHFNDFSNRVAQMSFTGSAFDGGASQADVEELQEHIAAVMRTIARNQSRGAPDVLPGPTAPPDDYIHLHRIAHLKTLGSKWDFRRLERMTEEINAAWRSKSYHAVGMLGRAILDHVPPLFGQPTFDRVIGHYGDKSFKDGMKHLDGSLRAIADGQLHGVIRTSEALPSANQVDFRGLLDRLLAEIATKPWERVPAPDGGAPTAPANQKQPKRPVPEIARVRTLLQLWQEKLMMMRTRNGATPSMQINAAADFLGDVEALYGVEVRRRVANRLPSLVDASALQGVRDIQMKVAATEAVKWEAELTADRLSPDRHDLADFLETRVAALRAEAPRFGLGQTEGVAD